MKISVWYHCLTHLGTPPKLLNGAMAIIYEQMQAVRNTGLLDACEELVVGINGGPESLEIAERLIPPKARFICHGLHSRAENLTIVELHKWSRTHPDWAVLYFHSKGATHAPGSSYGETTSKPWRHAMMADLVNNWKDCVQALKSGNDICCSHFMRNMGSDRSQHIACGNFWWANSSFLCDLPSMYERERIKTSGIDSLESRFEAEVWIGNGRTPKVHEFRPNGGGGVP